MSGHTALLIDHVGTYELASPPEPDLGHPVGMLAISPSISCYATWHTEDVGKARLHEDPKLIRLQAKVVVESLQRPILAGYSLGWTRMGPTVVGLRSGDQPTVLPPFTCPEGQQKPRG